MLKYIFSGLVCLLCYNVGAQSLYTDYAREAVLFSQTSIGGTARTSAFGGASQSLGGDISSISANPAGLGFYNRSSFSFTPVIRLGLFNSENDQGTSSTVGINAQLPNLGFVFQNRFTKGQGWYTGSFGIAINQENYFYNQYQADFALSDGSGGVPNDFIEFALVPFFEGNAFRSFSSFEEAEDAIFNDLYANLAYQEGLLNIYENLNGGFEVDRYDYDNNSDGYLTSNVQRRERVETSGGITNLDLSYGANFKDWLFLGASLNIGFLNYRYLNIIEETPNSGLIGTYELENDRTLSGAGLGLTMGVIFKPIQSINIGLSYKTPRVMSVEEVQTLRLDVFQNGYPRQEIINEIPIYTFISPQKISGGITAFVNKYGFLSADIQYSNYGKANYISNNGAFGTMNEISTSEELNDAITANIGAEARIGVFRLRAGYAYYQNPFRNINVGGQSGFEQDRRVVTAGLGFRKSSFFFDAAVNIDNRNNAPYGFYDSGVVTNSFSSINMFKFTIGSNF